MVVTPSSPGTRTAASIIAIVPAAGNGSRMQAACPKQYLTIDGKTLLEHAVRSLLRHKQIQQVMIALPPQDTRFADLELARHPLVHTVTGGEQRAESVLSALQAASTLFQETSSQPLWALVHDAARPCLHHNDVQKLLTLTSYSSCGGILATPVHDTMKRASTSQQIEHTVSREQLWHALTPQLFPLALLSECLQRALNDGAIITDEASALEYCGLHPALVCGRADNIKVTQPEDLVLAEFYLSRLSAMESV